jgi:DNA polymerase-1
VDPVLDLFDAAIASVEKADRFSYDTETTGLDHLKCELLILSLATADGAWAIPFAGPVPHLHWSDPAMRTRIEHVFSFKEKVGINWNGPFDIRQLRYRGFDVLCKDADGMVGVWLLDEMLAKSKQIGLKKQAKILLGVDMGEYEDTRLMQGIVDDLALAYGRDDSKYTYIIYVDKIEPRLREEGLMKFFERISMQVSRAIVEMEMNGCLMDLSQLKKVEDDLLKQNNAVLEELRAISGNSKFNPGSSKQLAALMFGPASALKIVIKQGHEWKVKSRQWSTDKKTLKRYKGDHPVVDKLMEFRKSKKLLSTYAIPLQARAKTSPDGRVHSSFRQTGTITGRLSSNNINFQNIATKGGIRESVIAPPGKMLVDSDYNQLELRMGGLIAYRTFGKSNIIEKYAQGLDLHEATRQTYAAFGIDRFDEVKMGKEEARRNAKIANFGYFYGRSADSFSQDNPGIPYAECVRLRELFLTAMYPEIPAMHDHCVKLLVEQGYGTTITGRRRRMKFCYGRDPKDVWWEGWVLWNSIVQGSAQDLIQLAMRDLMGDMSEGRQSGTPVDIGEKTLHFSPAVWKEIKMLVQVHDELIFESPENEAEDVAKWMTFRMQRAVTGQAIEFLAEAHVGRNWVEAKKGVKKPEPAPPAAQSTAPVAVQQVVDEKPEPVDEFEDEEEEPEETGE